MASLNVPALKNGAVPVTKTLMPLLEPVASFADVFTAHTPAQGGLAIHALFAIMIMKADAAVLLINHVCYVAKFTMSRLHVCVRDAINVKVFVNVGCQSQGFTLPVSVIIVGFAANLITHCNLAHVLDVIIHTLLATVHE
jgi:hypothetical protein